MNPHPTQDEDGNVFPSVPVPREVLCRILSHFPQEGLDFAFGYGSAVIPQAESYPRVEKPMVDFIFGVRDATEWHRLNIQRHRLHYSSLAFLGSHTLAQVQSKFGANIYYNTFVSLNSSGNNKRATLITLERLL